MTVLLRTARLEPGAHVHFAGVEWEVVGLRSGSVVLRSGLDVSAWTINEVLSDPEFRVVCDSDGCPPPTVDTNMVALAAALDSLPDAARLEVQRRLSAVTLLREGSIPGQEADSELVGLGITARTAILARRFDVTTRTVQGWDQRYREFGIAGLVDRRFTSQRHPVGVIDSRWRDAIETVLDRQVPRSRVTESEIVRQVREEATAACGDGEPPPEVSTRTLRRYLHELGRGRGRHLSTSSQRSNAGVTAEPWGRAWASRVGELVAIDATPLDVFALDAVTGMEAPVHLLLAIDLCSRSILAWRFTPGSPKAVDATMLLHDMLAPRPVPAEWPAEGRWRYAGVPERLVAGLLDRDPVLARDDETSILGVPCVVPDEVVIDHGMEFMSAAFRQACSTMGVSLHWARTRTPTDKAHVERVFGTINHGFAQLLPGYKGSSVYDRGTRAQVEQKAYLFIHEIEQQFAEWVAIVYQNLPHDGLQIQGIPAVRLTPNQAADIAIGQAGYVPIPVSQNLLVELLPTESRQVRKDGIQSNGLLYDEPENSPLKAYVGRSSPYPGAGRNWHIKVDPRDLSRIWWFEFDNPRDPLIGQGKWVPVRARGWAADDPPFNDRTLAYTKRLIREGGRTPSRENTLEELRLLVMALTRPVEFLTLTEKRLAGLEWARTTQAAIEAQRSGGRGHRGAAAPAALTGDEEPVDGGSEASSTVLPFRASSPPSGERTAAAKPPKRKQAKAPVEKYPTGFDEVPSPATDQQTSENP